MDIFFLLLVRLFGLENFLHWVWTLKTSYTVHCNSLFIPLCEYPICKLALSACRCNNAGDGKQSPPSLSHKCWESFNPQFSTKVNFSVLTFPMLSHTIFIKCSAYHIERTYFFVYHLLSMKWCKARHKFFIAVTKILLQKVFIVETVLEEQCANANAPSSLPSKTHTNQSLICNTRSPIHSLTNIHLLLPSS